MVSKEKLTEVLPDFWAKVKAEAPDSIPMGRENINGNHFPYGELINPTIVVNGNKARISVMFTTRLWKMKHFVFMLKENERWLITRLEWDYG